jgi:hypothetical protein
MEYESAERTQALTGVCLGNERFDREGVRVANDHCTILNRSRRNSACDRKMALLETDRPHLIKSHLAKFVGMSDFGRAGCPDIPFFWATSPPCLLIARLSAALPRNSEQLRDRERLGRIYSCRIIH